MLFARRQGDGGRDAVTATRDIVEIVAIVLAGVWAFYTFVYETRIKPGVIAAEATPVLAFDGTLTRLGTRGALEAVRLHLVLKNTSQSQVSLGGLAVTVSGIPIAPSRTPVRVHDAYSDILRTHYRSGAPKVVYRYAQVFRGGDRASDANALFVPGAESARGFNFFVPRHRYDLVRAQIAIHYRKETDAPLEDPLRLTIDREGRAHFTGGGVGRVSRSDTSLAELVLW